MHNVIPIQHSLNKNCEVPLLGLKLSSSALVFLCLYSMGSSLPFQLSVSAFRFLRFHLPEFTHGGNPWATQNSTTEETLGPPRIQPQRKPLGHPEFNPSGNPWATQNSTTEETLGPPRIQPQWKPLGHPEFNHRGNPWATQNSTTGETLGPPRIQPQRKPLGYQEFNCMNWEPLGHMNTQNSTTEETLGSPRIQPKWDSWAHAEEARHS